MVCEFSTPQGRWLRGPHQLYLRAVLPAMAMATAGGEDAYSYLAESIQDWPDQVALARLIKAAGWSQVAYRNLTGGIVVLHRARRPV